MSLKKKPYVIDVEPGEHEFWFTDSNSANKKLISGAAKVGVGIGLGAFTGSFNNMLTGATVALDIAASEKIVRNNYIHIFLQEGDEYKISVKPGKKGIVKIQELN